MNHVYILLDREENENNILGVFESKQDAETLQMSMNQSAMFGYSTQIVEHQIIKEKTTK